MRNITDLKEFAKVNSRLLDLYGVSVKDMKTTNRIKRVVCKPRKFLIWYMYYHIQVDLKDIVSLDIASGSYIYRVIKQFKRNKELFTEYKQLIE